MKLINHDKTCSILLLLSFVIFTVFDAPVRASETPPPCPPPHKAYDDREVLTHFAKKVMKLAPQLLSPMEFENYRSALKSRNCSAAAKILERPYLLEYPNHKCFFATPDMRKVWRRWIATRGNEDLDLCYDYTAVLDAQAAIDRSGLNVGPINLHDPLQRSPEWPKTLPARGPQQGRWWAVFGIRANCSYGAYQPACVALARLALETNAISYPVPNIYAFLEIAKLTGLQDPYIGATQTTLARRLGPEKVAKVEKYVRDHIAEVHKTRAANTRKPGSPPAKKQN